MNALTAVATSATVQIGMGLNATDANEDNVAPCSDVLGASPCGNGSGGGPVVTTVTGCADCRNKARRSPNKAFLLALVWVHRRNLVTG